MKCPTCKKGTMEVFTDRIKEDGIEYEAFRCSSCGEEIMNMKQLGVLAKKYRTLKKAKEVRFAKWGNSLAVRIPSDIAEEFNLSSGSYAVLTKDKEGIRIIPSH